MSLPIKHPSHLDHPPEGPAHDAIEAARTLARASRMLERASGELSLAHYRVLSAVASGSERATKIASRLAIGKPSVSASVESLSQRGLLARSEATGDQRVVELSVTAKGRLVLDQVEAAMVAQITDLCARTPDPTMVMQSLAWLGAALDQARATRSASGQCPPPSVANPPRCAPRSTASAR